MKSEEKVASFAAHIEEGINCIPFASDARRDAAKKEFIRLYKTYNNERFADEASRYTDCLVKQSAILPSYKEELLKSVLDGVKVNPVQNVSELMEQYTFHEEDTKTSIREQTDSAILIEEDVADNPASATNPDDDILEFIEKNRQVTDDILNLSPESEKQVEDILNDDPAMEFVQDSAAPSDEEIRQAAESAAKQAAANFEELKKGSSTTAKKKTKKIPAWLKVAGCVAAGFGGGFAFGKFAKH